MDFNEMVMKYATEKESQPFPLFSFTGNIVEIAFLESTQKGSSLTFCFPAINNQEQFAWLLYVVFITDDPKLPLSEMITFLPEQNTESIRKPYITVGS